MKGSPVDFEIRDSASAAPELFSLMEATAFRSAMSRCSPEDLDMLRLKIINARERGADWVDVTGFFPEMKSKVKIDELEKALDQVRGDLEAQEKKDEGERKKPSDLAPLSEFGVKPEHLSRKWLS